MLPKERMNNKKKNNFFFSSETQTHTSTNTQAIIPVPPISILFA